MLLTVIFGIASSLLTELATWANKKLDNTPLQGDGAFLVVLAISFVGAFVKMVLVDHVAFDWTNLTQTGSQIFAVAEVYFMLFATKLGLTVNTGVLPANQSTPTV